MAKRSGSPSSPLDLLTAAERKLFDTSRGRALAAATRAELTKLVGQARSLRDKWRDQFRAQRRTSQRAAAARGTGGNDRSLEKSTLFGEVLARLEARLAELGGAAARVVGGGERRATREGDVEHAVALPRGEAGEGEHRAAAVSYTHLTLPTKRIV